MAKKRRKLSKELEKELTSAKKKIELITAIINDIDEEDIQDEYRTEFNEVIKALILTDELYKQYGIDEKTVSAHKLFQKLIVNFENNYEI